METSRKQAKEPESKTLKLFTWFLPVLLFTLFSCSSSEDPVALMNDIPERTDISIRGDMVLDDFRESVDDQVDLISFNYYGSPSEDFDFVIKLQSGNTLTINLHDAQHMNPWEQVNLPYHIYAGQDLEDKLYYTNIIFSNPDGSCAYSTNFDNNIPPGTFLDVFKIIRHEDGQIQCRIRDMILYKTNNPDRTIKINGTFIGATNF